MLEKINPDIDKKKGEEEQDTATKTEKNSEMLSYEEQVKLRSEGLGKIVEHFNSEVSLELERVGANKFFDFVEVTQKRIQLENELPPKKEDREAMVSEAKEVSLNISEEYRNAFDQWINEEIQNNESDVNQLINNRRHIYEIKKAVQGTDNLFEFSENIDNLTIYTEHARRVKFIERTLKSCGEYSVKNDIIALFFAKIAKEKFSEIEKNEALMVSKLKKLFFGILNPEFGSEQRKEPYKYGYFLEGSASACIWEKYCKELLKTTYPNARICFGIDTNVLVQKQWSDRFKLIQKIFEGGRISEKEYNNEIAFGTDAQIALESGAIETEKEKKPETTEIKGLDDYIQENSLSGKIKDALSVFATFIPKKKQVDSINFLNTKNPLPLPWRMLINTNGIGGYFMAGKNEIVINSVPPSHTNYKSDKMLALIIAHEIGHALQPIINLPLRDAYRWETELKTSKKISGPLTYYSESAQKLYEQRITTKESIIQKIFNKIFKIDLADIYAKETVKKAAIEEDWAETIGYYCLNPNLLYQLCPEKCATAVRTCAKLDIDLERLAIKLAHIFPKTGVYDLDYQMMGLLSEIQRRKTIEGWLNEGKINYPSKK